MSDAVADARAWAMLAGAVAAALALLYVLRPRRRRVEVPFGGLWQRVLAASQARAFGRKWQRVWSFLLMLGLAGALLGALGEPIFRPEPPSQPPVRWSTVLVVDVSASMATLDGITPAVSAAHLVARLDEAKFALGQLLARSPRDEQFLVLAASGHSQVHSGWTLDRTATMAAVAALQPTDAGLDLQRALAAARAMLAGRPGGRAVLVTDAGHPQRQGDVGSGAVPVALTVGPARDWDRQADTALALAKLASATLDDLAIETVHLRPELPDPDRGTLAVRVRNDSGQVQAARLAVRAADGAQVAADFRADAHLRRLVEVALPVGLSTHIVADLDLGQARFAVQVVGKAPRWVDVAPWNDWGFAVLTEQRKIRVLWVGGANQFLAGAFDAGTRADVTHLEVAAYDPKAWQASDKPRHGIDVVVLDQVPQPPPEGMPALMLAMQGPADATATAQRLAEPDLQVKAGDHPLMRAVSFQDTNFDSVRPLPVQQGDTVLAGAALPGGRTAAVMVARDVAVRQIVWGLDLLETDLALRIALPILVANALGWLAGDAEPLVPPLEIGRPWAIQSPNRRDDWQYLEPGKPARPARVAAGQLLAASERHGVQVWRDGAGKVVARPTTLGDWEQAAQFSPVYRTVEDRPEPPAALDTEALGAWQRWLLAACLALAVEWLLYLRRRTV